MVITDSTSGSGRNAGDQQIRPASMSTPELNHMSHSTVGADTPSPNRRGSGTDDEDEDVPLAILAAHGFPNRNKPSNRLQTSPSNLPFRGSFPPAAPPASVTGESRAGSRASLPVFARNLPQDPYLGVGPVNPPNRDQLSMGGWQSPLGGVVPGKVHPSGLVGVIAGEERARAMRRGSPNPQVNHESFLPVQHPGMMAIPQAMGTGTNMNGFSGSGMPAMMAPHALLPADQTQMQLAQMMQVMQMQMQWMQHQMGQMQQNRQSCLMPQPPPIGMIPMQNPMGMPADIGIHTQRPFSVPLPESPRQPGRAMSLTPGMSSQWNQNSFLGPSMGGGEMGYAPSIAPSERSTVGMASRYRPVSTAAESVQPSSNRSSTFTASTLQQWAENSNQGRVSPSNTNTTSVQSSSKPGLDPKTMTPDDEHDDQGWGETRKRIEQRRGIWRLRRKQKRGG